MRQLVRLSYEAKKESGSSWQKKHGSQSGDDATVLGDSRTTTWPTVGISPIEAALQCPLKGESNRQSTVPTGVFLGRKQLVRVEARWIGRPAQVVIVEEWDQSVQFPSYLVRKCQGALSVALIGYLNGDLVIRS